MMPAGNVSRHSVPVVALVVGVGVVVVVVVIVVTEVVVTAGVSEVYMETKTKYT